MSESLAQTNYRLVVLHGAKPIQPPALQNIIVKVPGEHGDNMLVCEIWKSGRHIAAYPVATLMPSELVTYNIGATHVVSVTHKYTMIDGVVLQPSCPREALRMIKEVPPECIL